MKPATNSLAKKKHAIPHVYIILLIVILLATVLTYIVPAGQFDRETVDNVKMVIPGTITGSIRHRSTCLICLSQSRRASSPWRTSSF